MKASPRWDDLEYFAAIARSGGLKAAAKALGTSQATLSRRMHALEFDLSKRLFLHGKEGYRLTAEGRELFERVKPMEASASSITRWQDAAKGPTCVRISAGTWTSLYLSQNLTEFWDESAIWLPEFVHCDLDMDIARREVDIGIRNRRPDHPWLAARKTGTVTYCAYARDAEISGWIGPAYDTALTASGRWVLETHHADIITKSNAPQLSCSMAKAGIGRVVLPTFMGDTFSELQRVSDPIEELTSEEWLVSHQDARHEPAFRAALDALADHLVAKDRARA
ncbi:MAG: LysR family transcriptional regulator [Pseudomonadota bacterium]